MQQYNQAQKTRDASPGSATGPKIGPRIGRRGRLAAVFTLTAFIAACSSVPDAVNPVEWYKDARDLISGDDEKPSGRLAKDRDTAAPGADKPFPKLSTVPSRPQTSSSEERKALAQGLIADPQPTRQYSTEVVRRQGSAANPLPDVLAPVAVAKPPPPSKPIIARTPPVLVRPRVAVKPAPTVVAKLPAPTTIKMPTLPKVTLKAPKMASVSATIPAFGSDNLGTVVISGSGVQTLVGTPIARTPRLKIAPQTLPQTQPQLALRAQTRPAMPFAGGTQGSYQVATILFDNGSSRLKSTDRRILRQVAQQHQSLGGVIRIVGHASSRTRSMDVIRHKMVNLQVSVARAETVAKALVGLGAKPENLMIGAAADREPKYFEFMPSGEAGNRRTEIFIEY